MAFRHIVNLGNSIIGVSLLSMPYCFATSGILLSILTIIISSFINRFACHLIIKSARLSKRRNFENLAFGTFGISGKLITEIAILGFLLGSCVAFFVVLGDLCPSLITQIFDIPNYTHLRTFTMMFLGMFVALPLALKRRVEASFSAISMFLYFLLAIHLLFEAFAKMTFDENHIFDQLNYWSFDNYLQVLPIFVTCLSCQPQLFEVFDHSAIFSEEKHALARINETIKKAITICSMLYITVGVFGYLAFFGSHTIEGNLLVDLKPSLFSMLAKLGFLFTIVFSLPLCLFPCRTSLNSLLYGRATSSLLNEMTLVDGYIPDNRWLLLTVMLIVFTICVSIILPHIEFILGLVGSTTGALVCLMLPALFFINLTLRNNSERVLAQFLCIFGILILFLSTFTLMSIDQQELTSEGQMVRNLNLSSNLLLDKNSKLSELKVDEVAIEKEAQMIVNRLVNKKKTSINAGEFKLSSSNITQKLIKANFSSTNNTNNLNASNHDNKEMRLVVNKEKSGFINAVEMKKKSLSKEKLDDSILKSKAQVAKLEITNLKIETKLNHTSNAIASKMNNEKTKSAYRMSNSDAKIKVNNTLNRDSVAPQIDKNVMKNEKVSIRSKTEEDVKISKIQDKDFKKKK